MKHSLFRRRSRPIPRNHVVGKNAAHGIVAHAAQNFAKSAWSYALAILSAFYFALIPTSVQAQFVERFIWTGNWRMPDIMAAEGSWARWPTITSYDAVDFIVHTSGQYELSAIVDPTFSPEDGSLIWSELCLYLYAGDFNQARPFADLLAADLLKYEEPAVVSLHLEAGKRYSVVTSGLIDDAGYHTLNVSGPATVTFVPRSASVMVSTTTTGSTWTRPVEGYPPLALDTMSGNELRLEVVRFTVPKSGNYTITADAPWDSFLCLYREAFEPRRALESVMAANDDTMIAFGGTLDQVSQIEANLESDTEYVAVITGSKARDYGDFVFHITGAGQADIRTLETPRARFFALEDPTNGRMTRATALSGDGTIVLGERDVEFNRETTVRAQRYNRQTRWLQDLGPSRALSMTADGNWILLDWRGEDFHEISHVLWSTYYGHCGIAIPSGTPVGIQGGEQIGLYAYGSGYDLLNSIVGPAYWNLDVWDESDSWYPEVSVHGPFGDPEWAAFGGFEDPSVGQQRSLNGQEAFRIGSPGWLGDLPGGDFWSVAYASSKDLNVIVGQGESDRGREGFIWVDVDAPIVAATGAGMQGWGDLPGGGYESKALDVSADGTVAVGYATGGTGKVAVIWCVNDGLVPFHETLSMMGADLSGWTLTEAIEISDDGSWIAGNGINPEGEPQAWLAMLPQRPVILNADQIGLSLGTPVSLPIVATQGPDTFEAVGLPPGLTIDTGTGLIQGDPTARGQYASVVRATNDVGSRELAINFTVGDPNITSAPSASGAVHMPFSYTASADNGTTELSVGPLPEGLEFDPTTGVISGWPSQAGQYTVNLTATNAAGNTTRQLSITIGDSPFAFICDPVIIRYVGEPVDYRVGHPLEVNVNYSVANLPEGLSFNALSRTLSGNFTQPGEYEFQAMATRAGIGTGTVPVTLIVFEPDPDAASLSIEERFGHGLIIEEVTPGGEWESASYAGRITIRNPSSVSSFAGRVELQRRVRVDGLYLPAYIDGQSHADGHPVEYDPIRFPSIPPGAAISFEFGSQGGYPRPITGDDPARISSSADLYAAVYEHIDAVNTADPYNRAAWQASHALAIFVDYPTAPPSGGVTIPRTRDEIANGVELTSVTMIPGGVPEVNERGTLRLLWTAAFEADPGKRNKLPHGPAGNGLYLDPPVSGFSITPEGLLVTGSVESDREVTVKVSVKYGDGPSKPATQRVLIRNVANPQTITFAALPNKRFGDAAFGLSAQTNAGLAVSFASSDPSVVSISGATATILKAGTVTITASQTGNENYLPAANVERVLTIEKGAQSLTFGALANKRFGEAPFPLSATASSGLSVAFTSSDPSVVSVSGATATILKAGTVTITASQAGNENYLPAVDVAQTLVIEPSRTSLDGWLAEQFTVAELEDPKIGGLMADPDEDGMANLLEFAFNLLPKSADLEELTPGTGLRGLPVIWHDASTEPRQVKLEYVRRRGTSLPGIAYVLEVNDSNGLLTADWRETQAPETVTAIDAIWDRARVLLTVPSTAARYARLRVVPVVPP